MKQATLKAAGTAALGVVIAATAAGAASAATGGLSALPTGALPDTGGLTGTLNQAPALGGPVSQTTGMLSPKAGQAPAAQAPAADGPMAAAPAGEATRGLPIAGLASVAQKAPGPVGGLLGGAVPVSGAVPGLGG
ncbi:ATP-binding protein [Kitasatospora sp. NBC_01266]|uniref:ATP-binding protein n=1 Tax=Kitasatospora sp. NBC_01266 TaxID=2903572 RepID=UPI002E317E5D|nr:ATP-binding protein [Kitasatospora sp. NBC_01266]